MLHLNRNETFPQSIDHIWIPIGNFAVFAQSPKNLRYRGSNSRIFINKANRNLYFGGYSIKFLLKMCLLLKLQNVSNMCIYLVKIRDFDPTPYIWGSWEIEQKGKISTVYGRQNIQREPVYDWDRFRLDLGAIRLKKSRLKKFSFLK